MIIKQLVGMLYEQQRTDSETLTLKLHALNFNAVKLLKYVNRQGAFIRAEPWISHRWHCCSMLFTPVWWSIVVHGTLRTQHVSMQIFLTWSGANFLHFYFPIYILSFHWRTVYDWIEIKTVLYVCYTVGWKSISPRHAKISAVRQLTRRCVWCLLCRYRAPCSLWGWQQLSFITVLMFAGKTV